MSEQQAPYKIEGRPATIFRTVKNKDNPYVMIDRRPMVSFKVVHPILPAITSYVETCKL